MYKTIHVPAACEACKDTCLARHRRISVLFLLSVIILAEVCKSNWTVLEKKRPYQGLASA